MAAAPEAEAAACAYSEKMEARLAASRLQTYCRCAPEDETVTCSTRGCDKTFHPLCYRTVSFSYGLRVLPKKPMCPQHYKALLDQHKRQEILLKFMNIERDKFIEAKKEEAKKEGHDATQLGGVKVRILGLIGDFQMEGLQSSIPVTDGGFAQRNVSSKQASPIEKLIKENGWNALAGNLALVEIPYSDDEIEELKKFKLLPKDFTAPKPLVELAPKDNKAAGWLFKFSQEGLRMGDRRFAIIDGNNRIVALVRIQGENPDFLKRDSLNAYLVDVNIHNGLQVQLASMKCNSLSHSNIADTSGDRIQQYQGVIKFYRKMFPDFDEKKRGALTNVCRWVQKNAETLTDLLPADQRLPEPKDGLTFKPGTLEARLRLALKAPVSFVRDLQKLFTLHQSGDRKMSPGELKVFSHHYMKMEMVWNTHDPLAFLLARGRQLDVGADLAKQKGISAQRKTRLAEFQSYAKEPMDCAYAVYQSVPALCSILENYLKETHEKYDEDTELQTFVPYPPADHQDHRLVMQLQKLRKGDLDFEVYCNLYDSSKVVNSASPSAKPDRQFTAVADDEPFSNKLFPKAIRDALSEMCDQIAKVVDKRKEEETERKKKAEIEAKLEAAKQKAKKEAEELKKAKMVSLAADKSVAQAVAGNTRSNERLAPRMQVRPEDLDVDNETAEQVLWCCFCF